MSSLLLAAFDEFRISRKKTQWLKLKFIMAWSKFFARYSAENSDSYVRMQKRQYNAAASVASIKDGKLVGDCVAAVDWDFQNAWAPYRIHIFDRVQNPSAKVGLEFGCGPGRNLVAWGNHFQRIDGADISANNLKNAAQLASSHLPSFKQPKLFLTSGKDVGEAQAESYDFCFSVICLQHICVHEVRKAIMSSVFQALKPGAQFLFQMGYKAKVGTSTVKYNDNYFQAGATNGALDIAVESESNLIEDLKKIGFRSATASIVQVPDEISSVFETFIFVEAIK